MTLTYSCPNTPLLFLLDAARLLNIHQPRHIGQVNPVTPSLFLDWKHSQTPPGEVHEILLI